MAKAGWLASRRRYPEAASTLLKFAYSYRDGGSAWEQFPEEWQQTALENARATPADFRISIGGYPSAKELASIRRPIVCSTGRRSASKMVTVTRRLAQVIPTGTFQRIDGAAHAAPFDAPAAFAKVVADTLAAA